MIWVEVFCFTASALQSLGRMGAGLLRARHEFKSHVSAGEGNELILAASINPNPPPPTLNIVYI